MSLHCLLILVKLEVRPYCVWRACLASGNHRFFYTGDGTPSLAINLPRVSLMKRLFMISRLLYLSIIYPNRLQTISVFPMDMLASFFASNYALYANDPRHFGMWFPATSHQPTPYSALIHPYPSTDGRHLIKTPPERIESRKKETKTETVNFSIENILRDKSSTKEDDQQSLFDATTADNPEKEDDTTTQFSWLQCTRYKPPKLPRKFFGVFDFALFNCV